MRNLKKSIYWMLMAVLLTSAGMVWAQAQITAPKPKLADIAVEGVINGMDCYAKGTQCPADRHAIHVGIEKEYCLMTSKGIYHLANVGNDVKVIHVGHTVKVTGKVEENSRSIFVNQMEMLMDGGKYQTVWTEHDMDKEMEKGSWFHDMSSHE